MLELVQKIWQEGITKSNQLADSNLEQPLESYDFVALTKILERVFLKTFMRNIVPSLKDNETSEDHRLHVPVIPIKFVSI